MGTQALRTAVNAREFLTKVEESLGWRIRILSPGEEAHLALLGIRHGSPDLPIRLMALDIGGSSSELAQVEDTKIRQLISLPWGAVSIHEEFLPTDPPRPSELERMSSSLRGRLQASLFPYLALKDHLLVGTAGTVTTLAAIHLGLRDYDPEQVSRLTLLQTQIREIFHRLCRLPLSRRVQVPGLEAKRADIIVAGTAVLLAILEVLDRDRIRVSDGGLREGILLNLMGKGD